jgi:hypothetical protein
MAHYTDTPDGYPKLTLLDAASVRLRIALGLRSRSAVPWRVDGPDGPSGIGRLTIASPPDRRSPDGAMTDADREELGRLLGISEPVGPEGCVVPSGGLDHYVELIDRAEGRVPRVIGEVYPWDVEGGR